MVAMTRTIARQNGRQGITAFAVAPGYVDTPFNKVFAEEVGIEVAARDTGLGEVAQPQDVANVIAFLASGLARHATGTTIDVNGASYVR
jgi:NAD(P)-dependent dehydrogenase (short-subunit alcohol dehydrogenase family)